MPGADVPLEQVADLVTRWRRARGSMERVRVIAAGARTLGSLTPDDRRALAQALVEHGAPDVAARLEPRTGGALSASELTELARSVLSVDRATLDGLAASLDDPEERRRLLRDAGAQLEGLLDAPSGDAVPLPPPPGTPRVGRPARTPVPPVPQREAPELTSPALGEADLGEADLRAAELGGAELGSADLGSADLGRADLGTADPGPADLGSIEPGPSARSAVAPGQQQRPDTRRHEPRRRPTRAGPDPADARAPADLRATADVRAPADVAAPAPVRAPADVPAAGRALAAVRAPADVGTTLDRLRSAATARERLAAVAALEHHHLDADQLLRLLDAVPDGWQRRTAARRLLEAGAASEVDGDALVRRFARAADRVAVAGSLVDAGVCEVAAVSAAIGPRADDRLRRRKTAG